jgi:nucleoside 2-deoxyribosyltransferase
MIVFLAAPLTDKLRSSADGAEIESSYRQFLEQIIDALESAGVKVFSSHVRERWGESIWPPKAALDADVESLRLSDVLIAIVGDPPSPGVQFELGYAFAIRKPTVVCFQQDPKDLPHLCQGLAGQPNTQTIRFSTTDQLIEALGAALTTVSGTSSP